MLPLDDPRSTSFTFPITEKADNVGPRMQMSRADVLNLPLISKQVLSLCDYLTPALTCDIFLETGQFCVRVEPGPKVPLTPDQIDAICINALTILNGTAADIARNADRPEPHPLNVVSPNKHALNLLKYLASGSEEVRPPATLHSEGMEYPLPILTPADFTSTDTEETHSKTGTFRIIGLIRGENQGKHHFVLPGRSHVELPKNARWSWAQIHDVLDYEGSLVGTLLRKSAGDPWTVSDDTHVERQPPLF